MNKLKPCPFCGTEVKCEIKLYNDAFMYQIVCFKCGQAGVRDYDKDSAINRWNRRSYE